MDCFAALAMTGDGVKLNLKAEVTPDFVSRDQLSAILGLLQPPLDLAILPRLVGPRRWLVCIRDDQWPEAARD
jgi:hypothetical protein